MLEIIYLLIIPTPDGPEIHELVVIGSAVGGLLAIWGRMTATKAIKRLTG